jgi:hypothetical protein
MPSIPPFEQRIDKRFALVHCDGFRLNPYRQLSYEGRYEFAVGTGKSGGKAARQEVFYANLADALEQALINRKPICVMPDDRPRTPAKHLVSGRNIRGYEITEDLAAIALAAEQQPIRLIPRAKRSPQPTLSERAKSFSKRENRPEQAAFRFAVFMTGKGACVVSGCEVECALDAAHKAGRSWREGHNTAEDGWLLRKDLHALYGAGFLSIDSEGVVHIAGDRAIRVAYGGYDLSKIRS